MPPSPWIETWGTQNFTIVTGHIEEPFIKDFMYFYFADHFGKIIGEPYKISSMLKKILSDIFALFP